MERVRKNFQRFKQAVGISRTNPKNNKKQPFKILIKRGSQSANLSGISKSFKFTRDEVFNSEESFRVASFFPGSKMRLKKDYKIRNREGARTAEKQEILKIRKTQSRSFKSPIVRPVRVKSKSSWAQRLLHSKSSSSSNEKEQDIGEYFQRTNVELYEKVSKVYASQFMNREHFNLVGEDKNLGPLVLSIKYPDQTVMNQDLAGKTLLLLRLPTGLVMQTWNHFQLSNLSHKSPLKLAKLSFPNLSFSNRLLPVLSPKISELIAEYDENCGDGKSSDFGESKAARENEKLEIDCRILKLRDLQEKLISRTCKFLELSGWDFEEYNNFFIKKKSSFPKYLSFTLPVALKTPKSCSRSGNQAKSPKFMSLPKRTLQFDDENLSPPPSMNLKPLLIVNDNLASVPISLESVVSSCNIVDLTGQMLKLGTGHYRDEVVATSKENDTLQNCEVDAEMMLKLVGLKLEKMQMSDDTAILEKEREELAKNEKRLVRELATAQTIIASLKKRFHS